MYNDGPVRVWRQKGERFAQGMTKGVKKYNKSIMMWLCIASDGSSKLIRCDARQDSSSYQNTVLRPALNFIRSRSSRSRRDSPIVFMQDGASCHTSGSTLQFLATHRVQLLQDWPANSPDCNPVEHCWAWLSNRLVGRSFLTEDDLEAAIRQEWEQRPPTLLPNLYASMKARMEAVLAARGTATKY